MFGFIAAPCPRCTASELPAWRGAFCGLARCLAREYSAPAGLLVNRDATFLGLLGLSLDPAPPAWRPATCCNPLATPFPVDDSHPAIAHAAAVSVCGLATKLRDDALDESPLRRVLARSAVRLIDPAIGRATAWLNSSSFPTAAVLRELGRQEETERSQPLEADQPTAASFARIIAHLSTLLGLPALHEPLAALGSAHGRLVYWRDAWDDRERDLRRGRFNPFHQLGPEPIARRICGAWEDFRQSLDALPFVRHQLLLGQLAEATATRHAGFLSSSEPDADDTPNRPNEQREDKRKRKRRLRNKEDNKNSCCCEHCDCCPGCCHGSCGDAACDCGPGDSGCCDCCPCDGCDCCPCH